MLQLFSLVDVFLSAILVCLMAAIWLADKQHFISDFEYLEKQQKFIKKYYGRILVFEKVIIVLTFLLSVTLFHNLYVLLFLSLATIALLSGLILSFLAMRPINKQIISWTKDYIPGKWQYLRTKWRSIHLMRTMLSIVGFLFILIAILFIDP